MLVCLLMCIEANIVVVGVFMGWKITCQHNRTVNRSLVDFLPRYPTCIACTFEAGFKLFRLVALPQTPMETKVGIMHESGITSCPTKSGQP